MAITSTIAIDTISGTITTSLFLNGTTLIDTVTYTDSLKQMSFVQRNSNITLSNNDLITLLNLYLAFNNLIIPIFAPKQAIFTPFAYCRTTQTNDGINNLTWEVDTISGTHAVFSYSCIYPSGTVSVIHRDVATTMSYAQWLYIIYRMANFKDFALNAYNL